MIRSAAIIAAKVVATVFLISLSAWWLYGPSLRAER